MASYPSFPLQSNRDFFDKCYEKIIRVAANQIEYLYAQLRDHGKPGSPINGTSSKRALIGESSNYQRLVAEN